MAGAGGYVDIWAMAVALTFTLHCTTFHTGRADKTDSLLLVDCVSWRFYISFRAAFGKLAIL